MDDLISDIEAFVSDSDEPMAVSAVVLSDCIGYPKRLVEDDGESHDGELEGFDEVYDYACELFDTEDIEIEKDDKYVWFTDKS